MATIQFQGLPTSSSPKLLFPSMASSTWPLSFLRMRLIVSSHVSKPKLLHCENMLSRRNHWIVSAISKKKAGKTELDDVSEGESIDISSENSKKPSRRGTRKSSNKTTEEIIPVKAAADLPENIDISLENINISSETDKKPSRRGRKKSSKKTAEEIIPVEATTELTVDQEEVWTKNQPDKIGISSDNTDISSESSKKSTRRGPKKSSKKTIEEIIPVGDTTELTENHLEATKEPVSPTEELQNEKYYMRNLDPSEKKIDFSILDDKDEGENEGFMWPPLVICFGPAKASFIPYARPSKRIFDQEIHKEMPDLYWSPDQFFRAPGSAASSVAIALARLDGRVDFMGKLGHDSFGKDIWSELNVYGVQTRCTKIDDSVSTAVSFMKLTSDRDGLKAKCVGSCAEDTFLNSDINLDGLKEAKMLYFNSSALLDPKSKSTLMEVIRIMKSQGSLIFFDVNLPMPLWHSPEEAKSFLKEAFAVSNFIELTQQELDYLCGIERNVMERKRDVKFVHRSRKRLEEFWHDGLEVLFVTNGTSGVSYYTKEDDHYFVGTEDVQIEPSSCEMSASGDALVAALMKMLVSEPHMATDPSYLETSIWYAIESGLIAQTLATGESGFYAD